jgi:hypothetical protein
MKDREQADRLTAAHDRKKHRNRTGRFLEHDLPVQLWATLKTPETRHGRPSRRRKPRPLSRIRNPRGVETAGCGNEWWDDAFQRWINEVQRLIGFTVGYIRADEARPYRHIHVAIVSHRPVRMKDVEQAWLTVTGSKNREAVWVEAYRPRGGGIGYQMKSDGDYHCDWQLSPNIDLFRLSGDRGIHGTSTSRQRRDARRIHVQRLAPTKPRNHPSPPTPQVEPRLVGRARGPLEVGRPKARQVAAPRLVDPRGAGRLVAPRGAARSNPRLTTARPSLGYLPELAHAGPGPRSTVERGDGG